jgi:hypothetical protein
MTKLSIGTGAKFCNMSEDIACMLILTASQKQQVLDNTTQLANVVENILPD